MKVDFKTILEQLEKRPNPNDYSNPMTLLEDLADWFEEHKLLCKAFEKKLGELWDSLQGLSDIEIGKSIVLKEILRE